jgi:hypothetical protein
MMPTFKVRDGVQERIVEFMRLAQIMLDAYMQTKFPTLPPVELIGAGGTRYFNIQKQEVCGSIDKPVKRNSAWAFIDLTNGDILKPESWKKPAKHARGNVFAEDYGMSCVGPYGPAYMNTKGVLEVPYGQKS